MLGYKFFAALLDGSETVRRFCEWGRSFLVKWITGWSAIVAPVFPLLAIPAGIYYAYKHAKELSAMAMVKAGEYYTPEELAAALNAFQSLGTYIRCLARFIPLADMLGMLSLILGVRLAFTIYRFIKSWVPTIGV